MIRRCFFVVFLAMGFAAVAPCRAEGIPCWVLCHRPPKIVNAADVTTNLRTTSNPPLDWLAHSSGILTTYLGKMLGIQGWRNYHMDAQVSGRVTHASSSDDGFYTIDIEIDSLDASGLPVAGAKGRFIRVETLPWVRSGAPLPLVSGAPVCIAGGLWWDADGFLEIHPRENSQLRTGLCS